MAKNDLTMKRLIAAYVELDKKVGVDPPVEYDEMEQEDFEQELFDIISDPEMVTEEDEFSKATEATFDLLREKYGSPEDDEEDEEEEEPAPAKGKKAPPVEEEDDDEEEEEEPAPKKGKKAPAPVPIKKTVTRPKAIALALKNNSKMKSIADWVKAADDIYVKNNGLSNPGKMRNDINYVIELFKVLEIPYPGN
jgi:outer membrane biosynthesis protein TonB